MRRDGALARLSSITAAIGVAIIVGVGALGLYVGRALPGHHSSPTTGATASSGSAAQSSQPGTSQGGLSAPSTPTQSTPLPAPVTSGAS